MVGDRQIVGCCGKGSECLSLLTPPAFPGQAKAEWSGEQSANFILDVNSLYAVDTYKLLCDEFPVICGPVSEGVYINGSWSEVSESTIHSSTTYGDCQTGLSFREYTAYGSADSKAFYPSGSVELIAHKTPYYGAPMCDQPYEYTGVYTRVYEPSSYLAGGFFNIRFSWLAVAQRNIPGLRLRIKTGSYTWLVKVSGGVVTVYTDDNTKSFSTGGTILGIANAINASSISTWIEARANSWASGRFGLQFGPYPSGGENTANPFLVNPNNFTSWHYIFTGLDPGTMLKDMAPTYLNSSGSGCAVQYAPSGWTSSTEIPVYYRGEILPPRGVVYMVGGIYANDNFIGFNSTSIQYPQLETYENTEQGALSFLTDPIYTVIQDPAIVASWGSGPNPEIYANNTPYTWASGYPLDYATRIDTTQSWIDTINLQFGTYSCNNLAREVAFGVCPGCEPVEGGQYGCPECPRDEYGSYTTFPCSPPCTNDLDCESLCGVNCYVSGCFYNAGNPFSNPLSCQIDAGCVVKYSVLQGMQFSVTPPTQVQYTSSNKTSIRIK